MKTKKKKIQSSQIKKTNSIDENKKLNEFIDKVFKEDDKLLKRLAES